MLREISESKGPTYRLWIILRPGAEQQLSLEISRQLLQVSRCATLYTGDAPHSTIDAEASRRIVDRPSGKTAPAEMAGSETQEKRERKTGSLDRQAKFKMRRSLGR